MVSVDACVPFSGRCDDARSIIAPDNKLWLPALGRRWLEPRARLRAFLSTLPLRKEQSRELGEIRRKNPLCMRRSRLKSALPASRVQRDSSNCKMGASGELQRINLLGAARLATAEHGLHASPMQPKLSLPKRSPRASRRPKNQPAAVCMHARCSPASAIASIAHTHPPTTAPHRLLETQANSSTASSAPAPRLMY